MKRTTDREGYLKRKDGENKEKYITKRDYVCICEIEVKQIDG